MRFFLLYKFNRLFFAFLLTVSVFPVIAQTGSGTQSKEPVFMFAPLADVSFFGNRKPSVGGGFNIAYDGRIAMGLSALYFHEVSRSNDDKRILALEVTLFLRYYYLPSCTGFFIQINAGPLILFEEKKVALPTKSDTMSAGLSAGWRFPLGKIFFIESIVRGGYPFIVGGGASVGIRL